jgi:hypothetical protein
MRAVANRLFDGGLPALNAARAAHGLAPLTSLWQQVLEVDRILVLTSAAFDLAAGAVPDNVRYVGPILDDPQWAEPGRRRGPTTTGPSCWSASAPTSRTRARSCAASSRRCRPCRSAHW